eukprot:4884403-Lingulodinium_polyedra.AAC.1
MRDEHGVFRSTSLVAAEYSAQFCRAYLKLAEKALEPDARALARSRRRGPAAGTRFGEAAHPGPAPRRRSAGPVVLTGGIEPATQERYRARLCDLESFCARSQFPTFRSIALAGDTR